MSEPLHCPEIDCWHLLLEDTLPPEQRRRWELHLESCPACQQRLDRSREPGGELRRLGRQLGDPTVAPADPTLTHFLERLQEGITLDRPAAGEPVDLYFLSPTDRADLLGTLGDYEVREVIGEGGMGVVLKTHEPALHRLVAIKVLSPALAGGSHARRRFTREAQAAAAVCHEHIVAVHGVHEVKGLPYLVMQYVAGESLQERLDRDGPLPVEEVVRIGLQTAQGLAAAHAQGLIHRDIKPANLLLENVGDSLRESHPPLAERVGYNVRVKISDFGLARMVDDVGLTQNGVVAGTPEYMAPEQASGEPIDHRADLFSLGSVLFALCTGQPPFRASTTAAVLHKLCTEEAVPVRELNPNIPAWLEDLVHHLLAKNPAQRIQSAAELAALLEGYLAHLQQPATVSAPPLSAPPRLRPGTSFPGGFPGVALCACVLLTALAAAIGFGFLGFEGPAKQEQPAGQEQPARRRVAFDFRDGKVDVASLPRFGPQTETVFNTEPQGLRITLPAGRGDSRSAGLQLPYHLKGDFDIVLGYELVEIGTPLPQYGAGVGLRVLFDTTPLSSVIVSRFRKPTGDDFGSHKIVKGPDDKDQYLFSRHKKAISSRGKLRLVRTGSQIRYLVAEEGEDFKNIQSQPLEIGTDDVQAIKVELSTMYTPIALDVRLTELTIEADTFPEGVPVLQAPAPPTETPPEPGRKVWLAVLALSTLTIVGLAALGALYARHRRSTASRILPAEGEQPRAESAPAPPTAVCPRCGKTIRCRAELAGKKVKCPRCGQPALVPESEKDAGRPSS